MTNKGAGQNRRGRSTKHSRSAGQIVLRVVGWCLWLIVAWLLSSIIVSSLVVIVNRSSGYNLLGSVVGVALMEAVQLIILLGILVGVPARFGRSGQLSVAKRRAVKMKWLGLTRLPVVDDIAPLARGVVGYYALALIAICFAGLFLPDDIINQAQNVGFAATGNNLGQVIIILVSLVIVAPVFEELIFRGFMLGRLRQLAGFWPAAVIVSLLFAVAHGQINVGITTFVLSLISCYLYRQTGAIWAGVGLHMVVNLIAANLVFVAPLL